MKITFLGLCGDWIGEAEKRGYYTYYGDIEKYEPRGYNVFYVSPSNCLGFMDGGIDKIYSQKMFRGIEPKIKQNIKKLGYKTRLGRPYLPIGKAIITKTDIFTPRGGNSYIISSPIMLILQDVSKTRNAFTSTVAIIKVLQENKDLFGDDDELVMVPLCCGYGCMDPVESVSQIVDGLEFRGELDMEGIMRSQPRYYENAEWFNIDPKNVFLSKKKNNKII